MDFLIENKGIMGIMKKQLIEELIEDENSQIDFVEISSEVSARVELKADMARERAKFQLVHKLLLESGLRRRLEFSTNNLIVFYMMNYMFL